MSKLKDRFNDQETGVYAPGSPEWETHNKSIQQLQNRLINLLNKWPDKCGPPPAGSEELARRPLPTKDTYRPKMPPFRFSPLPPIIIPILELLPLLADNLTPDVQSTIMFGSVDWPQYEPVPYVQSTVNFDGGAGGGGGENEDEASDDNN